MGNWIQLVAWFLFGGLTVYSVIVCTAAIILSGRISEWERRNGSGE